MDASAAATDSVVVPKAGDAVGAGEAAGPAMASATRETAGACLIRPGVSQPSGRIKTWIQEYCSLRMVFC